MRLAVGIVSRVHSVVPLIGPGLAAAALGTCTILALGPPRVRVVRLPAHFKPLFPA